MDEHLKFIRGLLDQTENVLISTITSVTGELDKLLTEMQNLK